MKKVLVIAPYSYLPFFSGGQKFIAQFLEYLGKEIDLTVVTVAKNDFSLAKNYKTLPLLKKGFSRYIDLSLSSKLTELIKSHGYDTIIWEHPYYAWVAFLVQKKTGIKTVIHTHNIEHKRFEDIGKQWWPILRRYEKWFFKFADYILFITPADKQFAIDNWNIPAEKCVDVPFGIGVSEYPGDKEFCKSLIKSRHNISDDEAVLLFNGVLDYKPNLDALIAILEKVNPILLSHAALKYKILICGKRLPPDWNELRDYKKKNIIYAGFVEDIDTYFKGADLFLNPVQSGGGIKTKMVEAIGFGTTVIATETGATGINTSVCGNKIAIVKDDDWQELAKKIIENVKEFHETPLEYYNFYYWQSIIKHLRSSLINHLSADPVNK